MGQLISNRTSMNYQIELKSKQLIKNRMEVEKRLGDLSVLEKSIISYTELNLDEIQDYLARGEITPLDLLHAYQYKALQLIKNGNSGVCEFILEAEILASNLKLSDQVRNCNDRLIGIPVSIKELCFVQYYDTTFGLIKRCNKPSSEDSCVVKVLKQQGSIPFILTATSQTALTLSGFNPVFGNMSNPISPNHEPGGSSSGEAVLLALRGSPIGIGTDLGGSIRIPSLFCGLTGLKPTANRISNKGVASLGFMKSLVLRVCVGPMGHNVDDLAKAMRTLLCPLMFSLDPSVPPLPFNEDLYEGSNDTALRIGYYDTFIDPELVMTVPSIRRVIHDAVNFLKNSGHHISRFDPPNPRLAYELSLKSMAIDTKFNLSNALNNEPLNEHTKLFKKLTKIPHCIKILIDKIVAHFIGRPAALTRFSDGPRGEKQILELISQIELYQNKFHESWLNSGDFDIIICPVLGFPAFPKSAETLYVTTSTSYTTLYNLVNYPAGVVSISTVNKHDIEQTKQMCEQMRKEKNHYFEHILNLQLQSEGLPLGVQVVGKPWHEELVLCVMKQLEQLKYRN